MRKQRKNEKKTAVAWSLKYTTYPVRLVIKNLFRVQIGYVVFFLAHLRLGWGGEQAGGVEPTHRDFHFRCNFSGYRRPILFLYHYICLSISFPMPYSKMFYCKNSRRYGEKKTESRKRWLGFSSFFRFVQTYIFRDFSDCRRSILISETVIRFEFLLAFQYRIQNYSTAKTREDIAKRKRKVENDGSAFLHFFIRLNIFRDFSGCSRSIF